MATIERASVCTFDCPDTCSLSVTSRTIGSSRCAARKRRRSPLASSATRLRRTWRPSCTVRSACCIRCGAPDRRAPGQFERISWDAALNEIHARVSAVIERWGPQAVAPLNYAGPHGLLAGDSMSSRFFHKLGASQLYRRSLCGGVRSEAWAGTYGAVPGCPPEFAEHAELNVVWGNNATVTNLHLVRCVRRAKRKGGRLVVVDPLRTKIAEQADLHVQLLPGTDMLLAWSLAAELERIGRAGYRVHRPSTCWAAEEFMAQAREWPAARAAAGVRLGRRARSSTLAQWLAEADPLVIRAGQRTGARAQRRQRHPRVDRVAGAAWQAGQGQRHRPWRQQRFSEDAGTGCSGRTWRRRARAR